MERIKLSRLDWIIIFFLSVSFCFSNVNSLFNGVYSDAALFKVTNTSVSWWMYIVGYMANVVWIMLFAVVLGLSQTRLNAKQACMIGAYSFSLYKDFYDWFSNNNQGTRYMDWIITILLFGFVQLLFWSMERHRQPKQ